MKLLLCGCLCLFSILPKPRGTGEKNKTRHHATRLYKPDLQTFRSKNKNNKQ